MARAELQDKEIVRVEGSAYIYDGESDHMEERRADIFMNCFNKLMKFQLIFILIWLFSSSCSPRMGSLLGSLVSPIANIVFKLYKSYNVAAHFHGAMGAQFYRDIVGETFFVGFLAGALIAFVFVKRYWRNPWVFGQQAFDRLRTGGGTIMAIFLIFGASIICIGLGFLVMVWYGFYPIEPEIRPVNLLQFALWSGFCSATIYATIIFFFVVISNIFFLGRKIWFVFKQEWEASAD